MEGDASDPFAKFKSGYIGLSKDEIRKISTRDILPEMHIQTLQNGYIHIIGTLS